MPLSEKQIIWHENNKENKKEYDRLYRIKNKEKIAKEKEEYAKKYPDRITKAKKAYKEKNAECIKEAGKKYSRVNAQKIKEYSATYRKENAAKVRYWAMKRHTAKLQRTPKWLTPDDCWMIEQAYELAVLRKKMFGFDWHVDHIMPLQGKLVSGLHVPMNLQVIPGLENSSKSNRYEV